MCFHILQIERNSVLRSIYHTRSLPQVVFVCVRGLVLPVLVALRDISPGEQLLRDYGVAWWREVAGMWEVAEDQGLALEALWHGHGQGQGQGGGTMSAAAGPNAGMSTQLHPHLGGTVQCPRPAPHLMGYSASMPQPHVQCHMPPLPLLRPPPPQQQQRQLAQPAHHQPNPKPPSPYPAPIKVPPSAVQETAGGRGGSCSLNTPAPATLRLPRTGSVGASCVMGAGGPSALLWASRQH